VSRGLRRSQLHQIRRRTGRRSGRLGNQLRAGEVRQSHRPGAARQRRPSRASPPSSQRTRPRRGGHWAKQAWSGRHRQGSAGSSPTGGSSTCSPHAPDRRSASPNRSCARTASSATEARSSTCWGARSRSGHRIERDALLIDPERPGEPAPSRPNSDHPQPACRQPAW
jgi:hypothetical protein